MAGRRESPRAPILTQVEAQGDKGALLGRASDISVGGLLIETPDTLAEGATVVVRFFVPPQRLPLEAAGRVVRCDPGKSMAIGFLGLPEDHRQKIISYIQGVQGIPAEAQLLFDRQTRKPRQRRSARIRRRVAVVLSWQDQEGRSRQEAAETKLLSRYGAMVLAFSELKPGGLVRVAVPDTGKEDLSRVVWTAAAQVPGRVELGLEFMSAENVWGVQFPQDQPETPETAQVARRRSARLPRQIDVVLNWVDEMGRVREEQGQTRLLSKHGAAVNSPVGLASKQRFRLRAPEMNREAESHVVWSKPSELPGRTDLGVEFLETEDFWEIPFPPDPGSPVDK
ncbi:MAG: PilZ domain-containing protein [Acidobacteria bacterium]|nr:PilZ domain-containing protein [Acidobacteriota bacterium]